MTFRISRNQSQTLHQPLSRLNRPDPELKTHDPPREYPEDEAQARVLDAFLQLEYSRRVLRIFLGWTAAAWTDKVWIFSSVLLTGLSCGKPGPVRQNADYDAHPWRRMIFL